MSVSPSASQLIHAGGSVAYTFSENNDGNVALTSPSVERGDQPVGWHFRLRHDDHGSGQRHERQRDPRPG